MLSIKKGFLWFDVKNYHKLSFFVEATPHFLIFFSHNDLHNDLCYLCIKVAAYAVYKLKTDQMEGLEQKLIYLSIIKRATNVLHHVLNS